MLKASPDLSLAPPPGDRRNSWSQHKTKIAIDQSENKRFLDETTHLYTRSRPSVRSVRLSAGPSTLLPVGPLLFLNDENCGVKE